MADTLTAIAKGQGLTWPSCMWIDLPDGGRPRVLVAADAASRAKGLMGRLRLNYDEGMLFVFDSPGSHPMWMAGMLVPIDVLWLHSDGTILHTEYALKPCTAADPRDCPDYGAGVDNCKYVLELAAGRAAFMKIGEKVSF